MASAWWGYWHIAIKLYGYLKVYAAGVEGLDSSSKNNFLQNAATTANNDN